MAARSGRRMLLLYAAAAGTAALVFFGMVAGVRALVSNDEAGLPVPLVVAPTDPASPAPGPAGPAGPPPLPQVKPVLFDPAVLEFGGSGEAGAILAGPGIVPAVQNRTSYRIVAPTARMAGDLVALGLSAGGLLGSPDNPDVVGWWSDGVAPGEHGNVLLDGHVDYTDVDGNVGVGVAWLLRDLRAGDPILIEDAAAGRTFVYVVQEVITVGADDPDAVRYLQPTATGMLTFITCEGAFDKDAFAYADRRIVRADLVGWTPLVPPADADPGAASPATD